MLKRQKLQYLVAGGRKGLRAEEYIHEVNTAHQFVKFCHFKSGDARINYAVSKPIKEEIARDPGDKWTESIDRQAS